MNASKRAKKEIKRARHADHVKACHCAFENVMRIRAEELKNKKG
jgi:hypothetical protein